MIRIAIIDDHEMVREGVRAILQPEPDFEVVADSGSAVGIVDLLDRAVPDVLLLDSRLPDLSGPEACRLVTASHPEVAILMVSVYADEELVDECIRSGAKGYVLKDIGRMSLKESIRAVYRGEGAVSPTVAATVLNRMRIGAKVEAAIVVEPRLSTGQWEMLRLISQGLSNQEIATTMHLSANTVKSHVQVIFRRLQVRTRVEAAVRASREGWL